MRDLNNLNREHDDKLKNEKPTLKAGTFRFIENWKLQTVDRNTKEVIQSEEYCNLIVNAGLTRTALLINGNSSDFFDSIAIGTGTNAAANGDTALQTEQQRAAATLTNGTFTAVFEETFTFGSAFAITEAGIFTDPTSGGTMLARTVFAAKNVSATVDLIVTATITVSRV